jgi:hypothetical protein
MQPTLHFVLQACAASRWCSSVLLPLLQALETLTLQGPKLHALLEAEVQQPQTLQAQMLQTILLQVPGLWAQKLQTQVLQVF